MPAVLLCHIRHRHISIPYNECSGIRSSYQQTGSSQNEKKDGVFRAPKLTIRIVRTILSRLSKSSLGSITHQEYVPRLVHLTIHHRMQRMKARAVSQTIRFKATTYIYTSYANHLLIYESIYSTMTIPSPQPHLLAPDKSQNDTENAAWYSRRETRVRRAVRAVPPHQCSRKTQGAGTLLHLPVHPFPSCWFPVSQNTEAAEKGCQGTQITTFSSCSVRRKRDYGVLVRV